MYCLLPVSSVEDSVSRNGNLRTMSGEESSSIKQCFSCAVRIPGPSRLPEMRVYGISRSWVCSLVKGLVLSRKEGKEAEHVSGVVPQMAAADL